MGFAPFTLDPDQQPPIIASLHSDARIAPFGVNENRSGFTKSLALEVARHGVTVNTVSPGYLDTAMVSRMPQEVLRDRILPQIPIGRLGRPAEVAGLVAYLASDRAAYVTGANIAINGGQHMC